MAPEPPAKIIPVQKALLFSQGVFWGLRGPACLGLVCFKLQSCPNPEQPNFPLIRPSPRATEGAQGLEHFQPLPQAPLQDSGSSLIFPGYMLGAKSVPLDMVASGPQQCQMPTSWCRLLCQAAQTKAVTGGAAPSQVPAGPVQGM